MTSPNHLSGEKASISTRPFHTSHVFPHLLLALFGQLKNKLAYPCERCHARPLKRTSSWIYDCQRSWNVWMPQATEELLLLSLFVLFNQREDIRWLSTCQFNCLDSCWGNCCQVCNPGILLPWDLPTFFPRIKVIITNYDDSNFYRYSRPKIQSSRVKLKTKYSFSSALS